MAAKSQQQDQVGDGLAAQMSAMSRSQLYEVMSQMKGLFEKNEDMARQILIGNPHLTRALFQAQLALGMVQPAKLPESQKEALQQPSMQPAITQTSQPSTQTEMQNPSISQHAVQPSKVLNAVQSPVTRPLSATAVTSESQALPINPPLMQAQGFQMRSLHPTQPAQVPNINLPTVSAHSQLPNFPSRELVAAGPQPQTPQIPGLYNQQMQPPLPHLPRQFSPQPFQHQAQMQGLNPLSVSQANAPQSLMPQHPKYHSGGNSTVAFPHAQIPVSSGHSQLSQQLHQNGPEYRSQLDKPATWPLGLPEASSTSSYIQGQPQLLPAQGMSIQSPYPPLMTPEMEKSLLQQVMSLTPEQIRLLPPDQRNQVLQLQEMLLQR